MSYKSFKIKDTSENISMFEGYKVLQRLSKPKSPISVLFCTNDKPEEWLIQMAEYRTKTGIIVHRCIILASDLERKYEIYKKEGFIPKI